MRRVVYMRMRLKGISGGLYICMHEDQDEGYMRRVVYMRMRGIWGGLHI